MSEIDDLRVRVAALELEVRTQSTARTSMDDDQEKMSAQLSALRHLVQALSITQSEHTGMLERVERGQRQIIAMLDVLIRRDDPQ